MAECSTGQLSRALADHFTFTCLTRGDAIGLTTTAEAGLLSLLAIFYILIIIARNVRWQRRHLASVQIFHQPMDVLMASLIFADTLHGFGAVLSLKWVQAGKLEIGIFCTAQGIIINFGSAGVAFSTLAIAVYTFLGVWVRRDITSMKYTIGVVVAIWSFITLITLVPVVTMVNRHFMAPSPYWCWVNSDDRFIGWKIGIKYLWEWLAFVVSLVIYILLYLWMCGDLVIDETAWWRFHVKSSRDENPELRAETRARRFKSLVMLAYPAVYSVVVPLSFVRWMFFTHPDIHVSALTYFVMSLHSLLGFFDVILLMKTRPSSGLFGRLMFLTPARPPSFHEQHHNSETVETGSGLGRLP